MRHIRADPEHTYLAIGSVAFNIQCYTVFLQMLTIISSHHPRPREKTQAWPQFIVEFLGSAVESIRCPFVDNCFVLRVVMHHFAEKLASCMPDSVLATKALRANPATSRFLPS